jgi:hypothetical protein
VYYTPTPPHRFTAELGSAWTKRPAITRLDAGACFVTPVALTHGGMRMRKADEWTIERWKTPPRLLGLEFPDSPVEQAPPLWKDLTHASIVAVLLWFAAVIVFS